MSFIRQKIFAFIDLAKIDPVLAFKSQPETGGALAVAFVTLLGMLLSLIGVIGRSTEASRKGKLMSVVLKLVTYVSVF